MASRLLLPSILRSSSSALRRNGAPSPATRRACTSPAGLLHARFASTSAAPPASPASAAAKGTGVKITGAGAVGQVCHVIGGALRRRTPAHPQFLTAFEVLDKNIRLVLKVPQHLSENVVRAIAMDGTEGLIRGQRVRNTGSPITVVDLLARYQRVSLMMLMLVLGLLASQLLGTSEVQKGRRCSFSLITSSVSPRQIPRCLHCLAVSHMRWIINLPCY